jgi:hypothetical protein
MVVSQRISHVDDAPEITDLVVKNVPEFGCTTASRRNPCHVQSWWSTPERCRTAKKAIPPGPARASVLTSERLRPRAPSQHKNG